MKKRLPAFFFAGLLLCGCASTTSIEVPVKAQARQGSPIDGAVALVVTPELRAAKWEGAAFGERQVAPLGAPIERYTRELLSALYKDVRVVDRIGGSDKLKARDPITCQLLNTELEGTDLQGISDFGESAEALNNNELIREFYLGA